MGPALGAAISPLTNTDRKGEQSPSCTSNSYWQLIVVMTVTGIAAALKLNRIHLPPTDKTRCSSGGEHKSQQIDLIILLNTELTGTSV